MLLMIGVDDRPVVKKSWGTDPGARALMIADLRRRADNLGGARIVFAHEASGFGWGLIDALVASGIEGHVLAPTGIARSMKHTRRKTDQADAQRLLDLVRAYVYAGTELPSVWIPDDATRDDRELTRARLAVSDKLTKAKLEIRSLLKRYELDAAFDGWTKAGREQLEAWIATRLGFGAATALSSLVREWEFAEGQKRELEKALVELSKQPRHATVLSRVKHKGVGLLTALTFLAEMGDLSRFTNRYQVGSYLGLTPGSHESGQSDDRKGHITKQGSSRVRKVLCQAVWAILRSDERERQVYESLVARNPKRKCVAVVACMRRLGIRLWHEYRNALLAALGPPAPPTGPPPRSVQEKLTEFFQQQPPQPQSA